MPSDPVYENLAAALRERTEVIRDHALRDRDAAAHLERLKAVSQRIAALGQALPAGAPAQLRHFLLRCSYDKALAFLETAEG